ncbi:MAG: tetratricopeptide repeat protein [Planctomycetota bacterium]|jgi:tetratricopeptide (TPR) repeat protein
MTSEKQNWGSVKAEYLRQVEKALSSVRHPNNKEIVEDVRRHLNSRYGELEPDQQTWENFQAIITEMGPASEYAELLNPDDAVSGSGIQRKHLLWVGLGVLVIVVAALLWPRIAPKKVTQGDKVAAETIARYAWQLWGQRKLLEAEPLFEKAISKDPSNCNAWNGLGWSQLNLGKPLAAKESFEKCVELQADHPGALNGLGWIAKGQGETKAAIDYWQKAIRAAPNATAALNGLATTYMELNQHDKAVEIYEKWLKVEPDNAQIKADMERAMSGKSIVEIDDLPGLIAELSDPKAPRFEALNRIIKLGSNAVPALIEEMKTSDNWQIPKALGAIADRRAIAPLIEKLETSDFSPMREVVCEALELTTGEKLGASKEKWREWWQKNEPANEDS